MCVSKFFYLRYDFLVPFDILWSESVKDNLGQICYPAILIHIKCLIYHHAET